MKALSFTRFAFLALIIFSLNQPRANASKIAVSYYQLIQGALDIVIIHVDRIEGIQYEEKAVSHIERSFKGILRNSLIELPFAYSSWPTGQNTFMTISGVDPVSFEVGKRYVVFIQKWHQTSFRSTTVETEYQVLNYSEKTFFEIADSTDPRITKIVQLLKIVTESDSAKKINSMLQLTYHDSANVRIDAIEALTDFKTEKAIDRFISLLKSDSEPGIRYTAAWGLAWLHSDDIDRALMECLQTEKTDLVKSQLINVLSMHKVKKAVPILLKRYETEGYNVRNAILTAVSNLGDSTIVQSLIHIFSIDDGILHRHVIVQTIASFHTTIADEFSSTLLDTSQNYYLKSAVLDGWMQSNYTKEFSKIIQLASISCSNEDKARSKTQDREFPLLRAIEKLGTPEQILTTLKFYSNCSDPIIRQKAFDILKAQLEKDITSELREKIKLELVVFN